METVLRILRQESGIFDLGGLKSRLLLEDPGFDERDFGFVDFRTFLRAIPEVQIQMVDDVWLAKLSDDDVNGLENAEPKPSPYYKAEATSSVYQGLLRKKGWRWADLEVLREVVELLPNMEPAPAADLRHRVVECLSEKYSATEVRKAWSIVYRSLLLEPAGTSPDGSTIWKWIDGFEWDAVVDAVDRAILCRLDAALNEYCVNWSPPAIAGLMYGSNAPERIERLHKESLSQESHSGDNGAES